jgi:hypothetical protein
MLNALLILCNYLLLQKYIMKYFLNFLCLFSIVSCSDTEEPLIAPENLAYSTNVVTIDTGKAFQSSEPSIEGSAPFTFNIENSNTDNAQISINPQTGVITLNTSNTKIDGVYILDIKVSNDAGFTIFIEAFTINILKSINVEDGFYITKDSQDPIIEQLLLAESVENTQFASQSRAGFFANYIYLSKGSYKVVEIEAKHLVNSFGGILNTISLTSNCGPKEYSLINSVLEASSFEVSTTGLYKVSYDQNTGEVILFNIKDVGIIGTSTEHGWEGDTNLKLDGSISSGRATWELDNIGLKKGLFSIRLNCNWAIDRRVTLGTGDYSAGNGYKMFTYFTGQPSMLLNGYDGLPIEVYSKGRNSPDE